MMTNQKVSIILPTHNGAKYIRQSIESCLSQTYGNLELIIVDDASTDGTPSIIRSYNDPRIRVITQTVNKKLPASLNAGFAASTGEYLTWTSDDNYYSKTAIEMMALFLNNNKKIDFVYTNYYMIDQDGHLQNPVLNRPPSALDIENYIGPCFLYRRKVYETIGNYNPEYLLAEDYEYWLRIREKFKMKLLKQYFYYYRAHVESLSKINTLEKIHSVRDAVRDRFIPESRKYYYRGAKLFYANDFINARNILLKSLIRNAFNIDAVRILVIIFLPSAFTNVIRNIKRSISTILRYK